jgi:hypothetical protein
MPPRAFRWEPDCDPVSVAFGDPGQAALVNVPQFAGLHSSVPWGGVCEARLSELPSIAVFARTNVNDRRAAWLNQFR